MDYSEDHIALAAEYALGTLDAEERAQVETMMGVDKEFAGVVQAWEFRLGVLNQMVGSVEPPPEIWDKVRTAVGLSGEQQAPLVLPDAPPPVAPPLIDLSDISEPQVAAPAAAGPTNVVRLSDHAGRWRNIASVTSALAAALVAFIGIQMFAPDMLPEAILRDLFGVEYFAPVLCGSANRQVSGMLATAGQ